MKSKQLLTGMLLAVGSFVMVSCQKLKGDGPVVKQERTVDGYTRIETNVDGTAYVTQETGHRLTIEAQQNILDVIETPVIAGKLIIRFKRGKRIGRHDPVIVRVSAPVIEELGLEGSGDLLVTNDISTNGLSLRVSGSGELKAKNIQVANELYASISGSGNMFALGGSSGYAKYAISGSGGIDMLPVTIKKVDADISGSGNVRTTATELLNVRISGSGNVVYSGNPQVTTKISGSGNVSRAQ
ncbi:head GIN domain-containing protein [Pseudoflavitalea rhizosphaerae]|uniref:head GIN domain-containing protein n=1 Tax=Pseudoflavitalea rhizosphaerae TaxID=1884793 RepID=UPI000F8C9BE5|nr:head GIN domain-containing protein [Pseudoflavitalea rhizosphaerae]